MKNNQMIPKRKKIIFSGNEHTEGCRICIYPALHHRLSCLSGRSDDFFFRVFVYQIQYFKITGFYRPGKLQNHVYSGSNFGRYLA